MTLGLARTLEEGATLDATLGLAMLEALLGDEATLEAALT